MRQPSVALGQAGNSDRASSRKIFSRNHSSFALLRARGCDRGNPPTPTSPLGNPRVKGRCPRGKANARRSITQFGNLRGHPPTYQKSGRPAGLHVRVLSHHGAGTGTQLQGKASLLYFHPSLCWLHSAPCDSVNGN